MAKRGGGRQRINGNFNAQADHGGTANVIVYRESVPHGPTAEVIAVAERHLAGMPVDSLPTPSPLPVNSRMSLPPNPFFIGRDADLLALAASIQCVRRVAITGVGGVGKTQLASEFVHRFGQFFPGGVFWLDCSESGSIRAEIAACGRPGHLPMRVDFAMLPLDDQVRLVLSAWQGAMPRLLVLDNFDDMALLDDLPFTTGGCRVVITSRRGEWDPILGVQMHPLRELSHVAGIALLHFYRPDLSAQDTALGAIAAELGNLPLALHLAGGFLRLHRHGLAPGDYLAELRRPDVLGHRSLATGGLSPTRHEQNVARTFAISFEHLEPSDSVDSVALRILSHMAHLAPGETIPRNILIATLMMPDVPSTYVLVDDALARLIALGLVEPEADGAVRIHRLLWRFVRERVTDDKARTTVEEAITAIAYTMNEVGDPLMFIPLEPHLRFVVATATPRRDVIAARLCGELAKHLSTMGEYSAGLEIIERAIAIQTALTGELSPETATYLENKGLYLGDLGRFVEAHALLKRTLSIRLRAFGWNHPVTASNLSNLGVLLEKQGEYAAARPFLGRALAIRMRGYGERHPETMQSMNNVGALLKTLGDYEGAKRILARVLALRLELYGEEHPATATSLNNLGAILMHMGDRAGARDLYDRALVIEKALFGERHPQTAMTMMNIGSVYYKEGDRVAAGHWFWQANEIHEQVLGMHPMTAASLNNLGAILSDVGAYAEALPFHEQALRIRMEVLGPDHPETAQSLLNVGYIRMRQGQIAEARLLHEQALAIVHRCFGDAHRETIDHLLYLGGLLLDMSDYASAVTVWKRAEEACAAVFGAADPLTLLCHDKASEAASNSSRASNDQAIGMS